MGFLRRAMRITLLVGILRDDIKVFHRLYGSTIGLLVVVLVQKVESLQKLPRLFKLICTLALIFHGHPFLHRGGNPKGLLSFSAVILDQIHDRFNYCTYQANCIASDTAIKNEAPTAQGQCLVHFELVLV